MSAIKQSVEEVVPTKPALMQRLRLPLIVAGLALGLIMFLLIGVGLGKVKLGLERKQFAEQAAQFKARLADVENEKKLYEVKAEVLKNVVDQQKSHVAELEKKLEDMTAVQQKPASAPASATAASQIKAAASVPKIREYVRFVNADCTLTVGKGSNGWKTCLQQGRPQGIPKPAEVAMGKSEEKRADSQKTVEPHAHSAH